MVNPIFEGELARVGRPNNVNNAKMVPDLGVDVANVIILRQYKAGVAREQKVA